MVATLLATMPAPVRAAAESEDIYRQALTAIDDGNIPLAVERLETLQKIDGHHAGGLLDLAELYCRIGERAKGGVLLDGLESKFSPPPEIMGVIEQIRRTTCALPSDQSKWALGLALGHDSNVNQGTTEKTLNLGSGLSLTTVLLADEFKPKASRFLGFSGYYAHATADKSNFYGAFSTRQFAAAPAFDMLTASAGYGREFSGQDWVLSSDLSLVMRTLGGALYQQAVTGQLRFFPPAKLRAGLAMGLDLAFVYSHYPRRPAFDSMETTLLVPAIWQLGDRLNLRVAAGWALDNAVHRRPGGDRSGPVLRAEATYIPSFLTGWKHHLGWQKKKMDGDSAYAPPLLAMTRKQDQQFVYLATEKHLTDTHSLRLEYQQMDNLDTVSIYQSKSRSITLYWVMESTR